MHWTFCEVQTCGFWNTRAEERQAQRDVYWQGRQRRKYQTSYSKTFSTGRSCPMLLSLARCVDVKSASVEPWLGYRRRAVYELRPGRTWRCSVVDFSLPRHAVTPGIAYTRHSAAAAASPGCSAVRNQERNGWAGHLSICPPPGICRQKLVKHNITYSFNEKMTCRILNNEIRKKVLSQINKCHNEGAYISWQNNQNYSTFK